MLHMNHAKIVSIEKLLCDFDFGEIAFTNGCFDLFHVGHAKLLNDIKSALPLGTKLIVGVNGDISVKKNKGKDRPIIPEAERAYLVACHEAVDYVFIFNEKTVQKYLKRLKPRFWYKGGDYNLSSLSNFEKDACKATEVLFVPFTEGVSSTNIIKKIKS